MANPAMIGTDGPDTLTGDNGDDSIFGNGGDDTLFGLGGTDLLSGGPGTDTMSGGTGADTYQDTAANLNTDRITDFLPGDRIQISNLTSATAGFTLVGSVLSYNLPTGGRGSITIDNAVPGRLVVRDISNNGGVEVRVQQAAHNDFDGDGKSDILWRADDGTATNWLGQLNGSFADNWNAFHRNPGTNWQVAGTGDFNGDGRVDILWRANDGTTTNWLGQANGSFTDNWNAFHATVGNNWHVVGTGDFNGDGKSDILWQADDGTTVDWLGQANGSFADNWNVYHRNPGTNWHVAGTGDFNGDGIDDILWRANDGTTTNWLGQANGSFTDNWNAFHRNPGTNWQVAGTGDFNGDGIDDILWRANDGTTTDWLGQANGSFTDNWDVYHRNPGINWHVASIGDFNGDAIDDILWRADDGTTTDWLGQANGSFADNWNAFHRNPGTNWHVADPLF